MDQFKRLMQTKLVESGKSILPIALIVLAIGASVVPLDAGDFLMFMIGIVFLIVGMSIFTLGAEMSMQPLGSRIGAEVAAKGSVFLIAFVSFLIGVAVTVSEPDLSILASQIGGGLVFILTVSLGVGLFLVVALLRIVFGVHMTATLGVFYAITFLLCFIFSDRLGPILSIAFDSGGVTTGPMTVPFLLALGTGVSAVMGKRGSDDSFSIVALCSVGPILSVLVFGLVSGSEINVAPEELHLAVETTREGIFSFAEGFVSQVPEVLLALAPIALFAVLFQLFFRSFSKTQFIRIAIGMVETLLGLSLFLTGANIGFVPIGSAIGTQLAGIGGGWLLVPVGMILGYFIVSAEPSVYVLNKQVEHLSAGAISGRMTGLGLSVGVAVALGLSALRILTGIPLMAILVPGYLVGFALSFFVPKMFVGIAFDSGGVASGTMMSAFVLPLCTGACTALGGDILAQAFGCVALVALTPIISIQICGLIYSQKQKRRKREFISEREVFLDYSSDFETAEKEETVHG